MQIIEEEISKKRVQGDDCQIANMLRINKKNNEFILLCSQLFVTLPAKFVNN